MKWTPKYFGRTRVRHAFLLFPRTISRETRWLEVAKWREQVVSGCRISHLTWQGQEWIDDTCHRARFGLGE